MTREEILSEYSDVYKEIMGFRPRWDLSHLTDEELGEELRKLYEERTNTNTLRAQDELRAIAEFEATIQNLICIGAKDRETAIRWLRDPAYGLQRDLEWDFCLPIGYLD